MFPFSLKKTVSLFLAFLLASEVTLLAGIPGDKAMYVGGTVKTIREKAVGPLSTNDERFLSFKSDKGEWRIPYDKVTSLSYGQHAGRRIGSTIAWGATTLGIMALPILFSKKRRHYLTVEYTDEQGQAQAAIFEVGKNAIRVTLKTLEVRTGKKIEYEDEEARKSGNK